VTQPSLTQSSRAESRRAEGGRAGQRPATDAQDRPRRGSARQDDAGRIPTEPTTRAARRRVREAAEAGTTPGSTGRAARRRQSSAKDAPETPRRRGAWRRREPAPEFTRNETPHSQGTWLEITPGEVGPEPPPRTRPGNAHAADQPQPTEAIGRRAREAPPAVPPAATTGTTTGATTGATMGVTPTVINPATTEAPRRDVPRREVPQRAQPAAVPAAAAQPTVAGRREVSHRAARRAGSDAARTTDEFFALRTSETPRRTSRRDGHREAPNRPATSREVPHVRRAGPRRRRGVARRQIGLGLLALVAVAVSATAATGYALNRPEQTTATAKASAVTPCNQTGPGQREVEAYLATRKGQYGPVKQDGKQSATDCTAIAAFQKWAQIPSQTGYADATTGFLARQLSSIRFDQCGAPGDQTTVCVDLSNQMLWVVRSGRVILGPTPARSGRQGLETPTGRFAITQKKVKTVSSEYGTPLPYWERFVDDIGFHAADTPMYAPIGGSFGCINLLARDAKALYELTKIGTRVNVFGQKPDS